MELACHRQENLPVDSRERNAVHERREGTIDESRENLLADVWDSRMSTQERKLSGTATDQDKIVFSEDIYSRPGLNAAKEPAVAIPSPELGCPEPDKFWHTTSGADIVVEFTEQNFDKVDTDGNGFMSLDEIEEALKNCSLSNDSRVSLNALVSHIANLSKLVGDGSSEGISKADMDEFERLLNAIRANPFATPEEELVWIQKLNDWLTQE